MSLTSYQAAPPRVLEDSNMTICLPKANVKSINSWLFSFDRKLEA
jgi:hypothetical protein